MMTVTIIDGKAVARYILIDNNNITFTDLDLSTTIQVLFEPRSKKILLQLRKSILNMLHIWLLSKSVGVKIPVSMSK